MHRMNQTFAIACLVVATSNTIWAEASYADVQFDISAMGLIDSEHIRADGYCESRLLYHTEDGGATGTSWRYSGSTWKGCSAWIYENKTTTRIGLWDSAHVQSDGYASSVPMSIADGHQVLGNSTQYVGTYEGRTAWVYANGATKIIGLTDATHTATDGMQNSYGFRQNSAGQAIGYSTQYQKMSTVGQSAWLYSNGQTIRIGRAGSDAYDSSGHSWNDAEYINESGYVAGWGGRYSTSGSYLGHTPWLYANGQTHDIGLLDGEHIAADLTREGRTAGINGNGDVIGYSTRYSGTTEKGQTAWLYHNGATTSLGLSSGTHTASDGTRVSTPTLINGSGQVAGWSTQYVGDARGNSTWFYDGTTTRQIGLTDALHTKTDGTGYNTVVAINEAGAVAGVSQQAAVRTTVTLLSDGTTEESSENGLSAFHYQNGTTTQIGLFDSKHVMSNGWSSNTISLMNSTGQIAGVATRVNEYSGSTAWFYDPATNQTASLEFSSTSSGLASSVVQFLSNDGVCLGTFTLFEDDVSQGDHVFYWSEMNGFRDLGSIDVSGFTSQGWQQLSDEIVINTNGDVISKGKFSRTTQTQLRATRQSAIAGGSANLWGTVPVMLTAVPEPPFMATLASLLALLGLWKARRWRAGS